MMESKVCLNCHVSFVKPPRETHVQWNNRKYCGQRCRIEYRSAYLRESKQCQTCGEIIYHKFSRNPSKFAYEHLKYCSIKCRPISEAQISGLQIGVAINKSKIGQPLSQETRRKMSDSKKGKSSSRLGVVLTKETRVKISRSRRGKLTGASHPLWKGGVTSANRLARNSAEYKEWRRSVFERDRYTCVDCSNVGGNLNAHHINPFATHPDLRCVVSNGVTLCESCHSKRDKHFKRSAAVV